MRKNLRVVQINGIRGLFMTLFILSCLIAGFIAFPSFVVMNAWNYMAFKANSLLVLNFGQGLLLWSIIVFSVYIFNKKKFIVSFNAQQELTEDEVKEVVSRIKSQSLSKHVLLPKEFQKEFNTAKENAEELKEHQTENKEN